MEKNMEKNKVEEEVRKIWNDIMLKEWRWSPILIKIRIILSDDVETACILLDKLIIQINPMFFSSLNDEEKKFVFYHELSHLLLDHSRRRQWREKEKWNIACDCEINSMLSFFPHIKIWKGAITPALYSLPDDQTAEFYYDKLPPSLEGCKDEGEQGEEKGKGGKREEGEKKGKGGKKCEHFEGEIDTETRSIIEKIREEIKGYSHGTLDKVMIEMKYKNRRKNKLEKELFSFLKKKEIKYDWKRRNRRFFQKDIFIPKAKQEDVLDMIIAIDSSGSITNKVFKFFVETLKGTLKRFKFECDVIEFDVQIRKKGIFKKTSEFNKIRRTLGGGTDFTPVVRYANNQRKKLIILTDGDGKLGEIPQIPILWVLTQKAHHLPGRKIIIEEVEEE